MKKLLLLLFTITVFASCSDDKENFIDLSGRYISDEAGITEVFTLDLTSSSGSWSNYDKGTLKETQAFTYSASEGIVSFKYSDGSTTKSNMSINGNELVLGDVTYRKAPSKSFTSMSGHTYIAVDWRASTHELLYLIYKFDNDGTINIERRLHEINGELYDSSVGTYEESGANVTLRIPSVGTSYNEFTATLHNDLKSFTYQIYDISIGTRRTLLFYANK
ncbi:lipocalin family protein [Dysgonomonas mossii]|uniref:lipocalin family protein n=1 Tax=Dysgonomonas mossii TaxID=163665 RepID=UPI00208EF1AC|nr:lipocalin family protein [Dysgonomonas mossii]